MSNEKVKIEWGCGRGARMATYDIWFKSAARDLPAETLDPFGACQFYAAPRAGWPL